MRVCPHKTPSLCEYPYVGLSFFYSGNNADKEVPMSRLRIKLAIRLAVIRVEFFFRINTARVTLPYRIARIHWDVWLVRARCAQIKRKSDAEIRRIRLS